MASLHHRTVRTPRLRRAVLAAGAAAGLLLTAPSVAHADPDDDVAAAEAAERDLVAEVARIQGEVTAAEEQLQRMTVEAEAAADAALVAQAELQAAQQQAAVAAAELQAARDAVAAAQAEVVELGREAYMGGGGADLGGTASVLLDSEGPREVLERAATLDLLGAQRSETLEQYEILETQEAAADAAARAAVAERDAASRAAAEAQAAADARLAGAQAEFDARAAEKARLDERLRAAEVELLRLRGVRDAEAAYAAQQAAAQQAAVNVRSAPAASGGGIAPTTGRVTSCYGARWGTMHYGVDIAAPIGTPIYAPEPGVVLQAGPASGFGQAVYVQHGDGSITLYGHVDSFDVSAGQVVSAGQKIAEVGNRGQSTGPHLHFEVHQGGLYASRVNPVPWLVANGVSLGSC
ncbi:M23 family metallopeptidase [Geodermatophilus sp. SYSU D01106]